MQVVLKEEGHAREWSFAQRLVSGLAGLFQRPLGHTGQRRLDLLQPRGGDVDEFDRADLPLPHEFGKVCRVKTGVFLI